MKPKKTLYANNAYSFIENIIKYPDKVHAYFRLVYSNNIIRNVDKIIAYILFDDKRILLNYFGICNNTEDRLVELVEKIFKGFGYNTIPTHPEIISNLDREITFADFVIDTSDIVNLNQYTWMSSKITKKEAEDIYISNKNIRFKIGEYIYYMISVLLKYKIIDYTNNREVLYNTVVYSMKYSYFGLKYKKQK